MFAVIYWDGGGIKHIDCGSCDILLVPVATQVWSGGTGNLGDIFAGQDGTRDTGLELSAMERSQA